MMLCDRCKVATEEPVTCAFKNTLAEQEPALYSDTESAPHAGAPNFIMALWQGDAESGHEKVHRVGVPPTDCSRPA